MRKLKGSHIYSPSDLITFMESDYVSWMERFYLECPDAVQPDEEEEMDRIIRSKGEEHERAFLNELFADGHDVVDLEQFRNYCKLVRMLETMPSHLPA